MLPINSGNLGSSELGPTVDFQSISASHEIYQSRNSLENPALRSTIRKKIIGLTQGQKRALIENLQLEITERARRLRAQYVLQAQGLRTRVEIRVNRIPVALRRLKMGDLLLKYTESSNQSIAGPSLAVTKSPCKNMTLSSSRMFPTLQRAAKRTSDMIEIDKENESLKNSKRFRGLDSNPCNPSQISLSHILSPRSANPRVIPKSPARIASSDNTELDQSNSPSNSKPNLKSCGSTAVSNNATKIEVDRSTFVTDKVINETKIGAGRGKRMAPPAAVPRPGRGRASIISHTSDSSSNTVWRGLSAKKVPVKEKKATTKKGVLGAIKGIRGQKKLPAPETSGTNTGASTGGRVLRNRK